MHPDPFSDSEQRQTLSVDRRRLRLALDLGRLGPNPVPVKPRSASSSQATTPAIQQVGFIRAGGEIPAKPGARVEGPPMIYGENR